MIAAIRNFARDEKGAAAVEYGLIAAFVSIAGIVALQTMGGSLVDIFNVVSDQLSEAASSVQTE
jgi:pilus assembly protein Flp/PilA